MPNKSQPSSSLTLENIFVNGTFDPKSYGPLRWMSDQSSYTTLEVNRKKEQEIVRYEALTGAKTVLVGKSMLTRDGASDPIKIKEYEWSNCMTQLLIFTNTQQVWRQHTRGDYWILNLESGDLKQVGIGLEESSLMFAKFSPAGDRVAFVSKHNVFVEDISNGTRVQLTHDGSDKIVNGTFDWVYEEELGCQDGFRWSPDGKTIAYWHSDTTDIGCFTLIDNISGNYSKTIPLPYPKVGTKLSAVKIGLVSAQGGATQWLDIPGDPSYNYLARMDFIPNSNELMIQQLNRQQNTHWVWIAKVDDLSLTNLLTEKDNAFLDLHDSVQWIDDEKWFTWISERDGWRHLYRISRDGKKVKHITKGEFDVVSVCCIAPKTGWVYYIASHTSYLDRYLYRSRIDGTGHAERITPLNLVGHNSYQISESGEWAIHTFSSAITPTIISLVHLPEHIQVKVLEGNRPLQKRVDQLGLRAKEFFKVDIGDETLDAYMIKPIKFDPKKKYPVIFYVYGEPAGSTVQNNWSSKDILWHQYLAQQGVITISIDNRGTATPRGRKWRKSIYRKIGILATEDQAKAAKKIFSMFEFIDSTRVGVWGWSGGGSMTLNCMFRHPEIYKTGIAIAFVADQRLYDATYQERYMDLLEKNEKGYISGSPIQYAKNLKGKLMIIHGTADDNVHYQNFEKLTNELIRLDKEFSMMSYPMRAHGISEGEGTALHLRKTMDRFWKENL